MSRRWIHLITHRMKTPLKGPTPKRANGVSCLAFTLLLGSVFLGCGEKTSQESDPLRELDPSVRALMAQEDNADTPPISETAQPGDVFFVDAAEESGIDFHHTHGGSSPIVIFETLGPGACWIDFDGDGFLDLYLVDGNHRRVPNPGPPPTNRLFRNRQDGTFEDVTQFAGVGDTGYGLSCAVDDYDNDGNFDLYVTNYGPNVLYHNLGNGSFENATRGSGVEDARMSTISVFADFDGDSLPDLYVANFVDYENGPVFCLYNGIQSGCADREYDGLDNALYLNNGDGTFSDVTQKSKISDNKGRTLGVVAADLDLDGYMDIYVANDGGPNAYYQNRGDGIFNDLTLRTGTGYSEEGTGEAGMGVDAADYDNDGDMDLFITNFSQETYALYRNEGDNLFSYSSAEAGVGGPSYVPLGWGTAFFDYDNDGDTDLFAANGHTYDVCNLINSMDHFEQQNQLFENQGDGTFKDVTAQAGPGMALARVSRSAAFADYDNDGDVDILVGNNGQRPTLLRNDTGNQAGHWINIRLEGSSSPRSGVGSRITLVAGDLVQVRQRKAGGSYISGNDHRIHVGLGSRDKVDRLEIRWPGGGVEVTQDLAANHFYVAREGAGVTEDDWVAKR